jgi:BON domain
MRRFVFGFAMLTLATCWQSAAQADPQQDKQIAQEAIQRLQAEKKAGGLKGFSLDLQVEEGTLWLSGRVANKDQQDKALDIARRVPGVKQVVNDLSIAAPATPATVKPVGATEETQSVLVGSNSVKPATTNMPRAMKSNVRPTSYGGEMASNNYSRPVPANYGGGGPVAFAPARSVSHQQVVQGGVPGQPQRMVMPTSHQGVSPARYDQPQMPGYAWPSYAASPNYAGVSYPKQYSASAWPYIGPFYPYPQVPLGWRKVSLEWDDGWWFLDFKDRH